MKAVETMANRGHDETMKAAKFTTEIEAVKTTKAAMASVELNGYVARKDHEDHIDRN
jgi:hypothetical protein